MFGAGEGLGIIMVAVWAFLLIAGIMAIFIPFWVYRIRNEVIEMNKSLDKLVLQGKRR